MAMTARHAWAGGDRSEMSEIFGSQDDFLQWVTGPGLRIVLILVASVVVTFVVRHIISAAVHPRLIGMNIDLDEISVARLRAREDTIETFLGRTASLFIWFAAGVTILTEVGVNVAPVIASAGIVGLAIGFGAQTLVKDAIAGLFLLLENHYDMGDRVKLNNVEGTVIGVSLRRTTLQSDDGAVHTIPNGSITLTTNISAGARRPLPTEQ